jgi:hypothetical protein
MKLQSGCLLGLQPFNNLLVMGSCPYMAVARWHQLLPKWALSTGLLECSYSMAADFSQSEQSEKSNYKAVLSFMTCSF